MAISKIGVCTGGGDAPGLNTVIRAVVRSAINQYGWKIWGILDCYDGLIHPGKTRQLTEKSVRGIYARGGTILGTSNRLNPFRYPVGRGKSLRYEDKSGELLANFRKMGLDALVAIGGDGTLAIARELYEKGLPVVGVPKTIDNDIASTDASFGYDTAVVTATEALDKLHASAQSHRRIMIMEVMGRHAGWIAMRAGIAGAADVIVIPEIPFDVDLIAAHVRKRKMAGDRFSVVVAAEGAYPKGGEPIFQDTPAGEPGAQRRLGGIGYWLADALGRSTGMPARVVVLGYLQRGGSPSAFDRFLASRYGVHAVDLIAGGTFGHMVCLRGTKIKSVPLSRATHRSKRVNPNGEIVKVAEEMGIALGR